MTFHHAIIIPAKNEEDCLALTISEIQEATKNHAAKYTIAVGINATTDRSAEIAKENGAIVGETNTSGYGYGCMAAINELEKQGIVPDSLIFMAADGANIPTEITALTSPYESEKISFVIGQRTLHLPNIPQLGAIRTIANIFLGNFVGILTGRFFSDLGPYRLIDYKLFKSINPQELTWGWTIEPQVIAAVRKIPLRTVSVSERTRIAGEQKITGVSPVHSIKIAMQIAQAAIRAKTRALSTTCAS